MKRCYSVFVIIGLLVVWPTALASAHGVEITYRSANAIELTAMYDTGEPFSEGEVSIYAPGDPAKPWATGKCDENGRFTFTPDPTLQGTWDVQVRRAGHGAMVHIPIESSAVQSVSTGFSTLQIVIMSVCVVWGLVGTALYFSRRKN